MLANVINEHRSLALVILVLIVSVIGYIEILCTRRPEIGCVTWFFADVIASFGITTIDRFGIWRWPIGVLLFVVLTSLILLYYRNASSKLRGIF